MLNGKNSEWRRISAGVPQGSVLGALFIDYFVCHNRSIKVDDLINVQPIIGQGVS